MLFYLVCLYMYPFPCLMVIFVCHFVLSSHLIYSEFELKKLLLVLYNLFENCKNKPGFNCSINKEDMARPI